MKKSLILNIITIFFFAITIIILFEQYLNYGVWFEIEDIHHETLALSSFTLAIGILIGSNFTKK